jgi:ABC-type transport system involved in cytochrome c biogenesis permease subunit
MRRVTHIDPIDWNTYWSEKNKEPWTITSLVIHAQREICYFVFKRAKWICLGLMCLNLPRYF